MKIQKSMEITFQLWCQSDGFFNLKKEIGSNCFELLSKENGFVYLI
jgi:hypothetical protein